MLYVCFCFDSLLFSWLFSLVGLIDLGFVVCLWMFGVGLFVYFVDWAFVLVVIDCWFECLVYLGYVCFVMIYSLFYDGFAVLVWFDGGCGCLGWLLWFVVCAMGLGCLLCLGLFGWLDCLLFNSVDVVKCLICLVLFALLVLLLVFGVCYICVVFTCFVYLLCFVWLLCVGVA